MNAHLSERLSEYLDDALTGAEAREVEAHVEGCPACAALLDELRNVKLRARGFVDPPPPSDLWAGIATRIGAADATAPGDAVPTGRPALRVIPGAAPSRGRWFTPALAAAAALAFVAGGFAMWMALRPNVVDTPLVRSGTPSADTPSASADVASFDSGVIDGEIAELQRAVESGRGRLDPQTIQILEKNLKLIRVATDEAKRALASDPHNAELREYLTTTVQRKIDLMRRAATMAGV